MCGLERIVIEFERGKVTILFGGGEEGNGLKIVNIYIYLIILSDIIKITNREKKKASKKKRWIPLVFLLFPLLSNFFFLNQLPFYQYYTN